MSTRIKTNFLIGYHLMVNMMAWNVGDLVQGTDSYKTPGIPNDNIVQLQNSDEQ
jgi:hypothetical protein